MEANPKIDHIDESLGRMVRAFEQLQASAAHRLTQLSMCSSDSKDSRVEFASTAIQLHSSARKVQLFQHLLERVLPEREEYVALIGSADSAKKLYELVKSISAALREVGVLEAQRNQLIHSVYLPFGIQLQGNEAASAVRFKTSHKGLTSEVVTVDSVDDLSNKLNALGNEIVSKAGTLIGMLGYDHNKW